LAMPAMQKMIVSPRRANSRATSTIESKIINSSGRRLPFIYHLGGVLSSGGELTVEWCEALPKCLAPGAL
jgi:hypothetical protein